MTKENALDNSLYEKTGKLLRKMREEKGYSLEELSNKINKKLTAQAIYKYEHAQARIPVQNFNLLCNALDKNPAIIWEQIQNKNIENNTLDDLTLYIQKNISILTESDKKIIKTIIDERIKTNKK